MTSKDNRASQSVYKKILVPLDGSEASEAVLELAKNLAVRSGGDLTLLHVCKPEEADCKRVHAVYIEHVADTIKKDVGHICETVQCHFQGGQASVTTVLRTGEPAEEIVRQAEENGSSVIVMANHGRTGLSNSAMSDIANRVLRSATVPVWLIRTLAPNEIVCVDWPPNRVVVPLDGSEKAEAVLSYATEYAMIFDAELVLINVCAAPFITADYPEASAQVSWDEHVKRICSHYESQCSVYLETVKDRLEATGLKITTQSLLGDAADQIVEYIGQNRCDLVAMTSRGRSGISRLVADSPVGRWVFSDVTEQVLAASSRGMMVVKA